MLESISEISLNERLSGVVNMDLNNSLVSNINLNIPYLVIFDSFELVLLLLSIVIAFIIVFMLTSSGLLHIHFVRLLQIIGKFFVISSSFRVAMILGKFLGINQLGKVQK